MEVLSTVSNPLHISTNLEKGLIWEVLKLCKASKLGFALDIPSAWPFLGCASHMLHCPTVNQLVLMATCSNLDSQLKSGKDSKLQMPKENVYAKSIRLPAVQQIVPKQKWFIH